MNKGRFRFWDYDEKRHIWSDRVLQLSATDISNFRDCGYKVFYKLTREEKPKKNIYLIMGSVFHAVIEDDLKMFVKTGKHYGILDIDRIFKSKWEIGIKDLNDFGKFTKYQAYQKCLVYVQTYVLKCLNFLYPLNKDSIERFFNTKMRFNKEDLTIAGKVDLIDKSLFLVDHKTSSKEWTQKKANEEVQAYLYPYCIGALGCSVKGFRFNVVEDDNVNVFEVSYNIEKAKEILKEAFDVKRQIEDNALLKATNKRICNFCDYKFVCEEKSINLDDIKSEDL